MAGAGSPNQPWGCRVCAWVVAEVSNGLFKRENFKLSMTASRLPEGGYIYFYLEK